MRITSAALRGSLLLFGTVACSPATALSGVAVAPAHAGPGTDRAARALLTAARTIWVAAVHGEAFDLDLSVDVTGLVEEAW